MLSMLLDVKVLRDIELPDDSSFETVLDERDRCFGTLGEGILDPSILVHVDLRLEKKQMRRGAHKCGVAYRRLKVDSIAFNISDTFEARRHVWGVKDLEKIPDGYEQSRVSRKKWKIDLSSGGVNEILGKALERWTNIIFMQYSPLYISLLGGLPCLGIINSIIDNFGIIPDFRGALTKAVNAIVAVRVGSVTSGGRGQRDHLRWSRNFQLVDVHKQSAMLLVHSQDSSGWNVETEEPLGKTEWSVQLEEGGSSGVQNERSPTSSFGSGADGRDLGNYDEESGGETPQQLFGHQITKPSALRNSLFVMGILGWIFRWHHLGRESVQKSSGSKS
ncbi:hypothetical protein EV421DRAFT_1736780 [Armillaria borealis]|uniref:Uncharacterized protein n=1 Tax=Armillaria borealis TaxID=47425 RepID=A0AA39JGF2_9AGAR|nr:hypothetical protein EV421DRAFT_1736780 [Armillaria borealis]